MFFDRGKKNDLFSREQIKEIVRYQVYAASIFNQESQAFFFQDGQRIEKILLNIVDIKVETAFLELCNKIRTMSGDEGKQNSDPVSVSQHSLNHLCDVVYDFLAKHPEKLAIKTHRETQVTVNVRAISSRV